ncbi:3478_t:CDS:2, partial [Paraglomus occultum]
GTNIEFTYAVCRICLDPTYSGMDVSEDVVTNIMNSLENEALEQPEADLEQEAGIDNLEESDKELGEESGEYNEDENTSD